MRKFWSSQKHRKFDIQETVLELAKCINISAQQNLYHRAEDRCALLIYQVAVYLTNILRNQDVHTKIYVICDTNFTLPHHCILLYSFFLIRNLRPMIVLQFLRIFPFWRSKSFLAFSRQIWRNLAHFFFPIQKFSISFRVSPLYISGPAGVWHNLSDLYSALGVTIFSDATASQQRHNL